MEIIDIYNSLNSQDETKRTESRALYNNIVTDVNNLDQILDLFNSQIKKPENAKIIQNIMIDFINCINDHHKHVEITNSLFSFIQESDPNLSFYLIKIIKYIILKYDSLWMVDILYNYAESLISEGKSHDHIHLGLKLMNLCFSLQKSNSIFNKHLDLQKFYNLISNIFESHDEVLTILIFKILRKNIDFIINDFIIDPFPMNLVFEIFNAKLNDDCSDYLFIQVSLFIIRIVELQNRTEKSIEIASTGFYSKLISSLKKIIPNLLIMNSDVIDQHEIWYFFGKILIEKNFSIDEKIREKFFESIIRHIHIHEIYEGESDFEQCYHQNFDLNYKSKNIIPKKMFLSLADHSPLICIKYLVDYPSVQSIYLARSCISELKFNFDLFEPFQGLLFKEDDPNYIASSILLASDLKTLKSKKFDSNEIINQYIRNYDPTILYSCLVFFNEYLSDGNSFEDISELIFNLIESGKLNYSICYSVLSKMAENNILNYPENAFLRILSYFDYNSPICEHIIECIAIFLSIYKQFELFFIENIDFGPDYNNYFDSISNIFKICIENDKLDEIVDCYSDLKDIILFSANIIFDNENIINNAQKLIQIALDLLEERVSFIASVFISRCFGNKTAVQEDLEDFSVVISEYNGNDAKYCSAMVYIIAGLSSYDINEDMQNTIIEFMNSNIIIADNLMRELISYVSNIGFETNFIGIEKIEYPFSRDEELDFKRSCTFCLL